jgi:hypothetical protein
MEVFLHHIYEDKKGLRDLILHTTCVDSQQYIIQKLNKEKIKFVIVKVTERKMNVFFGRKECIDIVKKFGDKKLNEFTCEEDFMLGIMLGYSREQQYLRFIDRTNHKRVKDLVG